VNWSFNDKVALVTGAASGIGLATARAFAEVGAAVTLARRWAWQASGGWRRSATATASVAPRRRSDRIGARSLECGGLAIDARIAHFSLMTN